MLAEGFPTRLDAALVVALTGATEARPEQIVRRQRGETGREGPLTTYEDAHDGRFEIVVREARRHAAEVRKGAPVPIQEADLVLPLVDPREVAARVHQPHQKEPRLAPRAVDLDEHLEEIDFREIARAIRQRHKDLSPLPLPLRHGILNQRDADSLPLGDQQLVQPRRRQPLLAARPLDGLCQQLLDTRAHRLPHGPGPRRRLSANGHRFREVFSNRPPRNPELLGELLRRAALDQDLVTNDVNLIPLSTLPADSEAQRFGNPPSGPQVDHFPSGEWITFRAARPWDDGNGQRKVFDWHLKPSDATAPDRCVRIYFEYDENRRKTVVGWVGRHP